MCEDSPSVCLSISWAVWLLWAECRFRPKEQSAAPIWSPWTLMLLAGGGGGGGRVVVWGVWGVSRAGRGGFGGGGVVWRRAGGRLLVGKRGSRWVGAVRGQASWRWVFTWGGGDRAGEGDVPGQRVVVGRGGGVARGRRDGRLVGGGGRQRGGVVRRWVIISAAAGGLVAFVFAGEQVSGGGEGRCGGVGGGGTHSSFLSSRRVITAGRIFRYQSIAPGRQRSLDAPCIFEGRAAGGRIASDSGPHVGGGGGAHWCKRVKIGHHRRSYAARMTSARYAA